MALVRETESGSDIKQPRKPKVTRSKGWVVVNDFAFVPDEVDGFVHVPERMVGEFPQPPMTQVFFKGYTASVLDDAAALYEFLLQHRELKK